MARLWRPMGESSASVAENSFKNLDSRSRPFLHTVQPVLRWESGIVFLRLGCGSLLVLPALNVAEGSGVEWLPPWEGGGEPPHSKCAAFWRITG